MKRTTLFIIAACMSAPASAQTLSRDQITQRIDSIASAPVKRGAVAGIAVAVIKGRDTLLYKGYGLADLENQVPVTPQTVFRIGSITKQFTSAAIMKLVEQGKVSLDDDLTKYVRFPSRAKPVLVRHLMNHTSGIPSYTDIGPRFGAVMRTDLTRDSLVGIVAPLSPMFDPGSHFYYNNTGYFMLGMIIEKVAGKNYGDYLAETQFTPNGLTGTTYCDTRKLIPKRAQGYDGGPNGLRNSEFLSMELPFAAGSLCSTVGDLVSWTRKLASGQIVSAASYREMTSPVKLTSGRPMTYGYGLTADTVGGHRFVAHGGGINGFISSLMHFPDDSLVIAVLANTSPAPSDAIATSIARTVLSLPAPPVPVQPSIPTLSAADRARYVGTYAIMRPDGTTRELRIYEENNQLMAAGEGAGAPARLMSLGGQVFTVQGLGRITFDLVDGKVNSLVTGGGARTTEGVRKK